MTKIVKKCEICGEEFDNVQKYGAHKRHQHPGWREGSYLANGVPAELPEEKKFICKICGNKFKNAGSIGNHYRYTHPNVLRHHAKSERKASPVTATVPLAYCPCCGTDLKRLAAALAALEGLP